MHFRRTLLYLFPSSQDGGVVVSTFVGFGVVATVVFGFKIRPRGLMGMETDDVGDLGSLLLLGKPGRRRGLLFLRRPARGDLFSISGGLTFPSSSTLASPPPAWVSLVPSIPTLSVKFAPSIASKFPRTSCGVSVVVDVVVLPPNLRFFK